MYLDFDQKINGTMDLEILIKEQKSIKTPYLLVNNLGAHSA